MDCQICQKIASLYSNTSVERVQVPLGKYIELVYGKCQAHAKLLQEASSWQTSDIMYSEVYACRTSTTMRFIVQVGDKSVRYLTKPLEKIHVPEGTSGICRQLDRHWIDIHLLKDWIKFCDESHGTDCSRKATGFSAPHIMPQILIDTKDRCLVRPSPNISYAALSYVWGDATSLLTVSENVDDLMKPGAISVHSIWSALPRTTRDAINLAACLEVRFLWIDALCIVQDDEECRLEEMEKMANIFAGASFVIIAGQGLDANYGLRGLRGISEPRTLEQKIYSVTPQDKFTTRVFSDGTSLSDHGEAYGNRGWTFQEQLLSHRRIVFSHDSVRWECCESVLFEDLECEYDTEQEDGWSEPAIEFQATLASKQPDMRRLATLVSEFNRRDFTYSQDVANAFAGIMSVLAVQYTGGFVSGLPVVGLDVALLWQPGSQYHGRRRANRNYQKGKKDQSDLFLPSWSWIGWRCDFDATCWQADFRGKITEADTEWYKKFSYRLKAVSVVTWHVSNSRDEQKTPIRALLGPGSALASTQHNYRYLSCRTRRSCCALFIGHQMKNEDAGHYQIVTARGECVGAIIVYPTDIPDVTAHPTTNSTSVSSSLPSSASSATVRFDLRPDDHDHTTGSPLDLVEISQTYIRTRGALEPDEHPTETLEMWAKFAQTSGAFKVCNVLWVTWSRGVAQRIALGWVHHKTWKELALKEIDLTLE